MGIRESGWVCWAAGVFGELKYRRGLLLLLWGPGLNVDMLFACPFLSLKKLTLEDCET